MHLHRIMEGIIHVSLQASQENPPHDANRSMCCFVGQTVAHHLKHLFKANHWPIHWLPVLTKAHAERAKATRYHMLCGNQWLPLSIGASGSPPWWILLAMPIVLFITECRVDKAQAGKLEENMRSCRNCRHALLTKGWHRSKADILYSE